MSGSCSCPYTKGKENNASWWNMIGGADSTDTSAKDTGSDAAGSTAAVVGGIAYLIITILQFALFVYAIYLSIKCNGGFNFGSFLAACCCSPCYVAYRLALGTQGCV